MKAVALLGAFFLVPDEYRSHPPVRPLPEPSARPAAPGPAYTVDAARGSDEAEGSSEKPWKTLAHAAGRLRAGDTLYLRGGIHAGPVTLSGAGTPEKPITVRSAPGELAILDGGFAEFREAPATAWEPFPDGAPGEYRSAQTYPGLERVQGNFADSWIPLYAYRQLVDLRAENEYWTQGGKLEFEKGVYCGPGVAYDVATKRIHCRLAPTKLQVPPDLARTWQPFRGETDPRKLSLVIAGKGAPLRIAGAKHVRIQDLAVRGSARATVEVADSEGIEFDGVDIYGGSPALSIAETSGFRLLNSAVRGLCAPWVFRTIKYRGPSPYLVVARGGKRQNRDFEMAWCEFTDSHDFLLYSVDGLKFHHNLVDNHNDDGIYLSSDPPAKDVVISQNRISRCLTTFSFAGKHPTGGVVHITRNVFDLRAPVHYNVPTEPGGGQGGQGRIGGDHGGPTWEPMFAYHNTVLLHRGGDFRTSVATWGGHTKGSKRRVFNNILLQAEEVPHLPFPPATDDFQADGNLHWSVKEGPAFKGDLFEKFRRSAVLEASKKEYPPGWAASDLFADPKFVAFDVDWAKPTDLRLADGSPAIDAGVALPAEWPDPLRAQDAGKPDLGALPRGVEPWKVGVRARFSLLP